mmetsp:Transcript_22873/g.39528  ORF Transcript_22873/g.39528 Transcript_22873/m.39528 type:complete len:305 (-) Transcript_22873:377-1291(-)
MFSTAASTLAFPFRFASSFGSRGATLALMCPLFFTITLFGKVHGLSDLWTLLDQQLLAVKEIGAFLHRAAQQHAATLPRQQRRAHRTVLHLVQHITRNELPCVGAAPLSFHEVFPGIFDAQFLFAQGHEFQSLDSGLRTALRIESIFVLFGGRHSASTLGGAAVALESFRLIGIELVVVRQRLAGENVPHRENADAGTALDDPALQLAVGVTGMVDESTVAAAVFAVHEQTVVQLHDVKIAVRGGQLSLTGHSSVHLCEIDHLAHVLHDQRAILDCLLGAQAKAHLELSEHLCFGVLALLQHAV